MSNPRGAFYTHEDQCVNCGLPEDMAPALIGFHDDKAAGCRSHCFFKRQPETPEEIELALLTLNASCVEALRYGGTDPAILAKLRDMGLSRLCDHPLP